MGQPTIRLEWTRRHNLRNYAPSYELAAQLCTCIYRLNCMTTGTRRRVSQATHTYVCIHVLRGGWNALFGLNWSRLTGKGNETRSLYLRGWWMCLVSRQLGFVISPKFKLLPRCTVHDVASNSLAVCTAIQTSRISCFFFLPLPIVRLPPAHFLPKILSEAGYFAINAHHVVFYDSRSL